jgi:hypothetical protein
LSGDAPDLERDLSIGGLMPEVTRLIKQKVPHFAGLLITDKWSCAWALFFTMAARASSFS